MGEYIISRVSTSTQLEEGDPNTVGVEAFITQLESWCHVIQSQPTTDPRNPYILYWKIASDSEVITGRLGRAGYLVRFSAEPQFAARLACWYRSLVPEHIPLSFLRVDHQARPGLELSIDTSLDDLLVPHLHLPVPPESSAGPLPWRLMPGGQLGKFPPILPERAYAGVLSVFGAPDGIIWASGSEDIGIAAYQHGKWMQASSMTKVNFVWYRDHLWTTGEADQLFRYQGSQWHSVHVPFAWCRILRTDSSGYLWAAPREGLWRTLDGQLWEEISLPMPKPFIRQLCTDTSNAVWMTLQDQQAVYRWQNGQVETITLPRKARNANEVTVLSADSGQRLWVGTKEAGLWRWDGNKWDQMPMARHLEEPGLTSRRAWDVCVDPQHRVWVATGNGISCLMDGIWHTIIIALEPPSHEQVVPIWPAYSWTSCLHLDLTGRLWVGTFYGEIAWIDTTCTPYDNPDKELLVEQPRELITFVT